MRVPVHGCEVYLILGQAHLAAPYLTSISSADQHLEMN